MITPTPRAMSPQDIVRIYVPPAPLNEQQQQHNSHDTPKHTKQNSRSPSTKDSKPNSLPTTEVKYPNINNHSTTTTTNNNNNTNAHNNNNNNSNHNDNNNKKKMSPSAQQYSAAGRPPNTLPGLESGSNRNSIIYGSGDLTPVHFALNRSDEDLTKSFADASLSTNSNSLGYIGASSSSRRGSLSRKSPSAMFESNMLMECSHMLKRRLSNSSINYEVIDTQTTTAAVARGSGDIVSSPNSNGSVVTPKRMTSFEQLAAAATRIHDDDEDDDDEDDHNGIGRVVRSSKANDENDKYSPDDENYCYNYKYRSADSRQRSPTAVEKSKRFVSDSNVHQYESISMRQSSNDTVENQAANKRRPNSSGNETSLFQFQYETNRSGGGTSIKASIKEYKRFYGTSADDTCDEELSILNSPDTVPLLSLQLSPSSGHSPHQHAPASHIPIAKAVKSPTSSGNAQLESPIKPSRIPIIHGGDRKTSSSKCSPAGLISPNSNDLSRVLPPIDIVSSSSSSNNSLSSRKLIKSPPTSPNGQAIVFNRPTKLPTSKNGTSTTIGDSNTIRIKVNQSDNQ